MNRAHLGLLSLFLCVCTDTHNRQQTHINTFRRLFLGMAVGQGVCALWWGHIPGTMCNETRKLQPRRRGTIQASVSSARIWR